MVTGEQTVYFPLTHAQKRIWHNEMMYPDLEMSNVGYLIRFYEWKDPFILDSAINKVIQANPGLRIRLKKDDKGDPYPMQYVSQYQLEMIDRLHLQKLQDVIQEVERVHNRKFTLYDANLFYFSMIHFDDNNMGLYVKMHHIIVDGISAVHILEQILEIYKQLKNGKCIENKEKPSYKEYVDYEIEYVSSNQYASDEKYWLEKYQTVPQETRITRKIVESASMKIKRQYFSLSPQLHEKTKSYIAMSGANMFLVLTAALSVYFSRYQQQNKIIIGRAVHNRQNRYFREMVGMFVTTLTFQAIINEDVTFSQMLQTMQKELWSDLRHQQFPYDQLVNKLRKNKVGFEKLINIQISENPAFINRNGEFEIIQQFFAQYQENELFFLINPRNLGATKTEIALDYQCDRFTEHEITIFIERLLIIIENLLDSPEKLLREIPTVTKEEYNQLVDGFNNTKREYPDKCIPELFEEITEKYQDKIALTSASHTYTYQQLNAISDYLALKLLKQGVKKNSFVGIMVGRSVEYVIGILAILKSGAAYLPIDPDYPVERKKFILEDGEINIVLVQRDVVLPSEYQKTVIPIPNLIHWENEERADKVSCVANELAYVMYTSGTTGNPKAALITHQNVVRLVKNPDYVKIRPGDKIIMTGAVAFDANTFEIWGALLNGGCVYIAERHELLSPDILGNIIASEKVNILWLSTSLFNKLVDEREDIFDNLTYLLVGGEVLSPLHMGKVLHRKSKVQISNVYGPTENTTFSTCYPIDEINGEPIPIGRPISNSTAYVVDHCLQPLPVGAIGELCVGGDGVAEGYWKRPGLTAEKFVKNPFTKGGRLYRTGDFAYWLENGNLMFVGRKDNQVKIRGHRIELAEVEAQIIKTATVKNVAVIDVEDERKNKYLAAFYTTLPKIRKESIRPALLNAMPDYMVPKILLPIHHIPLNENGKVNRKELREILSKQINHQCSREEIISENEKIIVNIFEEVLGRNDIKVDDNFFEVGGDSLNVISIVTRIKEKWRCEFPVQVFWAQPTIREISHYIERQEKNIENIQGKVFNPKGHKIFCFHSILGDFNEYQGLAQLITECSFHSLQVDYTRPAEIKKIADYIQKEGQAKEPIVLIGYSSGGIIAFAVTQELEKRGIRVSVVIMLDSHMITVDNKNYIMNDMSQNVCKSKGAGTEIILNDLKQNLDHLVMIDYTVPVSADIINLRSNDKREEKELVYSNWGGCTKKTFYDRKGYGDHIEMLSDPFLTLNAQIITLFLKK